MRAARTLATVVVISLVLVTASAYSQSSATGVTEFSVNGLKVLAKQRPGSQTVAAGLFFRGGSSNITPANSGIEALMLDLASEASENFPLARMRRELSRLGTQIGSGVNFDYSALTLGATRQAFDRSWEIFTDAALRPSFAPEDFDRVKGRRLLNLRSEGDSPDSLLQILQERASFTGHTYANSPDGTVESVSRITLDDVRRYHQKLLRTSQLLLVVVGDVDPQTLRQKVQASFSAMPEGSYVAPSVPPLSFREPSLGVTARDLPTNYVQGIFAAPSLTSPDIYAMRAAGAILGDRVFEEVRVKRSLSYAPEVSIGSRAANLGSIYVTAVDANQAVQVMLTEIGKLQTENVDAELIGGIVQQFLTQHYLSEETNAAQAGILAQNELIGGGWRNGSEFLDRVRAVTPADVRRVANTYIHNIQFVVVGNPQRIDRLVFLRQPGR